MKAVFINNNVYGLLNFRPEVINSFRDNNWEIIVVLPNEDLKNNSKRSFPKGWKVYATDMQANGMNPFKDLRYLKSLISILKKEKPDIVVTYTVKPNIYGSIACAYCHIPNIAMLAGLGFLFKGNDLKKKIGRTLYKFAINLAKKVIVLNKSNYEQLLLTGFIDKSKLIWLKGGEGVNLEKYPFKPKSYKTVRFLMVARLLYDKGYREFIEAASIVKNKNFKIEFELLGRTAYSSPMGVPQEVLEKDIKSGIVKYLGVSNDVPSYLNREGTIVVIPSKYLEGLNRSLMEACATGCPIITTNIPGCQETVNVGINGFLVPKGDSEKLAEAMIKIIELSPEQREHMSIESRKLAEQKFDVNDVIKQYHEEFSKILNGKALNRNLNN